MKTSGGEGCSSPLFTMFYTVLYIPAGAGCFPSTVPLGCFKDFFSPRFMGDSIQFDELGCSTTNVSSFGNHNHVESPTTENPPTVTTSRPWALLQSSKRPGDCKHFDGAVVGGTPHDLDGMHLSLAGVQEQGLREAC